MTQNAPARSLEREDLLADPVDQFRAWFEVARRDSGLEYPEAMTLSTIDKDGWPQGRIVLLKGFDHRGFVFYTNAESHKGAALERTPRAALTFYWERLERQVRVVGVVDAVTPEEADAYFASRPRGSQIGAWASRQSRPLDSRATLDARVRETEERFEGDEVYRPEYWTGYRVVHHRLEFWQGRESRLHDRFVYRTSPDGGWGVERLYP